MASSLYNNISPSFTVLTPNNLSVVSKNENVSRVCKPTNVLMKTIDCSDVDKHANDTLAFHSKGLDFDDMYVVVHRVQKIGIFENDPFGFKTFSGPCDLVYDFILWSKHNECILSALSDNAVKMWHLLSEPNIEKSVKNKNRERKVVTFQHTCFVYCAQLHPTFDLSHLSSLSVDFQRLKNGSKHKNEVNGLDLTLAVVSKPTNIIVQASNFYSDYISIARNEFSLEMVDLDGVPVESQVNNNKNGTYAAFYIAASSHPHIINITLHKSLLESVPWSLKVNGVDFVSSNAFGLWFEKVNAGKPTSFKTETKTKTYASHKCVSDLVEIKIKNVRFVFPL